MFLKAAVLASAAIVGQPALAATVVAAGARVDTGSSWRTGADAIGGSGYYLPGFNARILLPTFVASVAPTGAVYPGNGGYASIDDPLTTPGATPSSIVTGTFNPFPGTGNTTTPFSFTIGTNAPQTIRVGLLFDNLDIAGFNSSAVALNGPGQASASYALSGAAFNNRQADFVFFDITGATAGDVFNVVTTGGDNGCGCLGGVSFDAIAAPVPEPATWGMMILGFGMAGFGLRRRTSTVRTSVRFV